MLALAAQASQVPYKHVNNYKEAVILEQPYPLCTKNKSLLSCDCHMDPTSEYYVVDCEKRGFSNYPQLSQLPPKTDVLRLTLNNIHHLSKLEKNDDIQYLHLSANDMVSMDNFAFEGTAKLQWLDLSYNLLTDIPETAFETLDELQYLNLSNNKIRTLPKKLLSKCPMLHQLNLANNPLKYIEPEMFSSQQMLQILNLAGMNIFSLESPTFKHLQSLVHLDLSDNAMESVPTDALRVMPKLKQLDLSKNNFPVLNEASFYGLYSLETLKLNQIKGLYEIQKKTFSSLFNLRVLHIEANPMLYIIDRYAFMGVFNQSYMAIKEVSLRHNHLTTLDEHMLPFCKWTRKQWDHESVNP